MNSKSSSPDAVAGESDPVTALAQKIVNTGVGMQERDVVAGCVRAIIAICDNSPDAALGEGLAPAIARLALHIQRTSAIRQTTEAANAVRH